MKPIQVTFTGTWEDEDNHRDFDYEVTGWVTPGREAKINAEPERCYPAEPAMFEDWDVTLTGASFYDYDGGLEFTLSDLSSEGIEKYTRIVKAYLSQNESQLAERAFEAAEEMLQSAKERDL